MSSWNHGYVTDSPYTFSFQPAQSPAQLAITCAMMGVAWEPRPGMCILDIGCGRGLTVNVLAAANPEWQVLGLDYNPAHIAEALELAAEAKLENAGFIEADLATMTEAEMDRLPELDLITIHGVWTWVSDDVRAGIVRLLARRLKPGGLCYVGYNVQPGFGADSALQRLVRHLAAQERTGTSPQRAQAALAQIRTLAESKPAGLPITPMLQRLLDEQAPLNHAYIAHEFLTEHWRPEFHEDVCAALGEAKLEFVGSATLHENVPDMILEPAQRRMFESFPQGPGREFLKDLCMQRPFRRDVFIRGLRRLDPTAALDGIVLQATRQLPEESPKLSVPVGVAELPAEIWCHVAAALAQGPQSLGTLRRLAPGRSPNPAELAVLLCAGGLTLPILRQNPPDGRAAGFNRALYEMTRRTGMTEGQLALASPAAAAGLPCGWLELAVAVELDARDAVPESPETLVRRILPGIEGEEAEGATEMVTRMIEQRLGVWRRFGVVGR